MSHSLMLECERKRLFSQKGKKTWKWVEVRVSTLTSDCSDDIRCKYCHGQVRVHKQHVTHGPADHVQHRSRRDSENCRGGSYFRGNHRISLNPVL